MTSIKTSKPELLFLFLIPVLVFISCNGDRNIQSGQFLGGHEVILDSQGKILPWYTPGDAYDHFLHLRWDFVKNRVPMSPGPPPRNLYPQYYFYCAFKPVNGQLEPDSWMNDIGEKIPNWFESARLYYAYTGDTTVMDMIRDFMDYTLEHGISAPDYAWPHFPYTTTNAGDTLFRGFTTAGRFVTDEIQVDHAGEMGLAFFRMFQYCGDRKYLEAALRVADVLVRYARPGTAAESVWPYRVVMKDGRVTAPYGGNWTGCYMLMDNLAKAGYGNPLAYRETRDLVREFLLRFPMKSGYWTDGHSDTDVKSNTYKSNLSASNMTLCLFDYPDLDPEWRQHIPALIRWTEDNFIFRSAPGEPATQWGANIVGEQDSFMYKMDYQTARYAAACARWYSLSGDPGYREKAVRALNWVTYCNDSTGMAFESPLSKGILSWYSDSYGECPRMFYQAFAGMPELAPPHENHILYSEGILNNVHYAPDRIAYSAVEGGKTEYVRLSFRPEQITVNSRIIPETDKPESDGCIIKDLGRGDYAVEISHTQPGKVVVSATRTRN